MTAVGRLPVGGATIAAVERDTGLSKDTLRVWERRYRSPVPHRDARGERLYSKEQVEQLRLIKRLLDAGHRAGQVVGLSLPELSALSGQPAGLPGAAGAGLAQDCPEAVQNCYDLVKRHDAAALRRALARAAADLGLPGFVTTVIAPLNELIGNAWMTGRMEVFEEHVYTGAVTAVLRHGIDNISADRSGPAAASPRVLLTTFPQESHGLGLLMAETLMVVHGCHCVSLGVQTPVPEIVKAARAHGIHIVALSFSGSLNPRDVTQGLGDLRRQLPSTMQVWAGGACPVLHRRKVPGIRVLSGLQAVAQELQEWRAMTLAGAVGQD